MRVVRDGLYTHLQYSFLRRKFFGGELVWGPWKNDSYYANLTPDVASLAQSAMDRQEKEWADEEHGFKVIAESNP